MRQGLAQPSDVRGDFNGACRIQGTISPNRSNEPQTRRTPVTPAEQGQIHGGFRNVSELPLTPEAALIHHHQLRGYSTNTLRLDLMLLSAIGDPQTVTPQQLEAIILRSRSRSTRATYSRRLRSIFKVLTEAGIVTHDRAKLIPVIKQPPGQPKPLSRDQLKLLLDQARPPFDDIFLVASLTGARAAELWAMEGVDLSDGMHGPELMLHGKGSAGSGVRDQMIPAHPKVVQVFDRYATTGRLWPQWSSPSSFSVVCAREMRAVLGVKVSLHSLRHTFATQLLEVAPVTTVSKLMRHQSVATTMIYAEVADEARRVALDMIG